MAVNHMVLSKFACSSSWYLLDIEACVRAGGRAKVFSLVSKLVESYSFQRLIRLSGKLAARCSR